jgi:hypothetical protein
MSLRMTSHPNPLRARVASYALGAYKVLIKKCCRRNFKTGSFDWKFKGLVAFLIVESDWRATKPPVIPIISPNTSNQSFEIDILFDVVQRSRNYVFEDDTPPTALRARVASYALLAYNVYIESVVVKTSKTAHLI